MQIQPMQNHLRIDIEDGLNYYEVISAIQDISKTTDCGFNHILVRVQTELCQLTYGQLGTIIAKAATIVQAKRTVEKVAMVVNTGLQAGIIRLFMAGVADMDCSFEVFRDCRTAVGWLAGDASYSPPEKAVRSASGPG